MYKYIFLLSAFTVCCISYELESVAGTALEQCIKCICYAKTGTSDTHLCGRELLTFAYWKTAGSLTTSSNWEPEFAWKSCREDVNCILNTVKRYTEQYGVSDLNSDGKFNCQDRFGIQIWENICDNRQIALGYFDRFYSCLPNVLESEVEVGDNQNVGGNHNIVQRSNQNYGGSNQNRGESNRNGGRNKKNPGRNKPSKAQVIKDQVLLVLQNITGNNLNVQQNVGFIGTLKSQSDGFEENFPFERNPNGGGNNQNRGGNNHNGGRIFQNISRTYEDEDTRFQQTVIGYNNKVDRNFDG